MSNGKEGFVIEDPGKVETLVEKILYLSDPVKLKEVSIAARALAEQYPQKKSYHAMLDALTYTVASG